MTDIVEKLRHAHTRNLPLDDGLMGEAAVEIERLRAERDRLRDEVLLHEAAAAEATDEIDRLRVALREIVQQCFDHEGRANIAATALFALKETGHE